MSRPFLPQTRLNRHSLRATGSIFVSALALAEEQSVAGGQFCILALAQS